LAYLIDKKWKFEKVMLGKVQKKAPDVRGCGGDIEVLL